MSQGAQRDDSRDSDPALDRTVRLPSQAERTITSGPPSAADSEPTIRPAVRPSEPTIADGSAAIPIGAKRFGKFLLLGELGAGGMGTVYKAHQTDLDRIVALKALHGAAAAGTSLIERFQREARAAARLDHAGIVRVYEVGESDGVHFFTMELVDGENLLSRVRTANPPLQERVRWIRDAARALHYAHENGLVHRDVKPHNIMVTREGGVKVADFGLARDVSSGRGLTVSGEVMGTPHYMAPEQARGLWDQVGPRADVYSLGATLYELIAGTPPVDAPEILQLLEKVAAGETVPLRSRAPSVPRDLETIVAKALDPDPSRRYQSAGALAEDLDRFLRFEAILARPESWAERMARRLKKNRRRILAVAGAAALILGGAVFLRIQGRETEKERAAARLQADTLAATTLYQQATDAKHVLANGGLPKHIELLTQSAKTLPTYAAPCLRLAIVHAWMGHRDESFRWFREAIRRSPDAIEVRARMATLSLLVAGREEKENVYWRDGMAELERLEAQAPKDPHVRLARLHLDAMELGDDAAERIRILKDVEGLVDRVPESRILLAGLRGFYYHPMHPYGFSKFRPLRDLGAAFDVLERLVVEDPLHLQARMALGLIRYELGDLPGAERDLRFCATHAPIWDAPHYYLGRVLASERRLADSVESLQAAIRIDPEAGHYNYLALVLGLGQRYDEALAALGESDRIEPGNGEGIALRGMVLFCLGREKEAEEQVRIYAAREPEYLEDLRRVDADLARPELRMALNAVRKHLLEFQDILFLAPEEKATIRSSLALVRAFPRLQQLIDRYQHAEAVRYELQDLILNISRYEREVPRLGEFARWLGAMLGFKADLHMLSVLTEFWIKLARDGEIVQWSRFLTAKDYLWRAGTRYRLGDLDGAQADLDAALEIDGGSARAQYGLATIWALRGEAPRCADALAKARQCGWTNFDWVATDPDFAKVRDDGDVREAAGGR